MSPLRAYRRAVVALRRKMPRYLSIAWKLAFAFSVIIALGLLTLGTLFGVNQAKLLEEQTMRLGSTIVVQAAQSIKEPLLAADRLSLEIVAAHLAEQELIRGLGIYTEAFDPIIIKGEAPREIEKLNRRVGDQRADPTPVKRRAAGLPERLELLDFVLPVRHEDLVAGYVAVSLDYSLMATAKRETLRMVTLTTVLTLLAGIITSFFLGKRLTRPISHITEAGRAIAQGNYDYRFEGRRKDELGVLMRAMNVMSSGLLQKEKVEQLFSRYVSPNVARQVLKELETLETVELGGRDVKATVFFADIAGFTGLSEEMEPSDVSDLLNLYFGGIAKSVHFWNGHIDKYMGDCAMAVFGVPEESENHALNGIACAWMIQALVKAMNERRRAAGLITVEFRIGVNSGTMLAGNMGAAERMEFTVVGDAVNLASRLSHLAEPGGVLITEEMHHDEHLNSRVATERQGTVKIRGKKQPVKTLRITGIETGLRQEMAPEIETILSTMRIEEMA